jgi:hypothetical protein
VATLGEPGDFFFHYTKAATAFEHILPGAQIRLSPYGEMRDPQEGQAWSFGAGYVVESLDHDEASFD